MIFAKFGWYHLHKSRYSDIVHQHNPLTKGRAWRCSWRKIVIVFQPTIRTIFSIWVQWIYNFHFSFQRRTCLFYSMIDRLWLVPYDAYGTDQLEAQLLVATCVEVRYHYTLTCEDGLILTPWFWSRIFLKVNALSLRRYHFPRAWFFINFTEP